LHRIAGEASRFDEQRATTNRHGALLDLRAGDPHRFGPGAQVRIEHGCEFGRRIADGFHADALETSDALATNSAAIAPFAPGRFSTMNDPPMRGVSHSAVMRAIVSVSKSMAAPGAAPSARSSRHRTGRAHALDEPCQCIEHRRGLVAMRRVPAVIEDEQLHRRAHMFADRFEVRERAVLVVTSLDGEHRTSDARQELLDVPCGEVRMQPHVIPAPKCVLGVGVMRVLQAAVPIVVDAEMTAGGLHRFHAIVSVRKASPQHEGLQRNAIMAAFGALKDLDLVIVVDDDIDIRDPNDVEYALATRMEASRDLVIVPQARGHEYVRIGNEGIRAKLGIDATVPPGERDRFRRVEFAPVEGLRSDELTDAAPQSLPWLS
jgi:hypothetical protein